MNPTPTPNKRQRHADIIGRALLSGEPVNSVVAGTAYGVWRLSSVIHRLRRRGWPILVDRDCNNGLARYRLPAGWTSNHHRAAS